MPKSLKDKIRAADDIKSEMVEVPEWSVTVEVRTISGARRAEVFSRATDAEGKIVAGAAYISLIIASAYDPETGEPLFGQDDIEWLKEKSAKATERLATVAARLAGIGEEALKQAVQD